MTPEDAKYAGPKLSAVCEKLNIPPVLNFGPCLAIGRLEIVATELAEAIGVDIPQLPLVLSAAQWLEEQALADGCFGLALFFSFFKNKWFQLCICLLCNTVKTNLFNL